MLRKIACVTCLDFVIITAIPHPIYRDKVAQINGELAKRFANHPGVILWHLSNEYGGECHCPLCQEAFRQWLKDKYQTLDALNKAWWTTFGVIDIPHGSN